MIAAPAAVSGPRKKILLVDDEAAIVQSLRYNLERSGYTVVTAGDGRTAVALAATRSSRISSSSTSCCPCSTASRHVRRFARSAACRSSCSPPRIRSSTRCWRSSSGADDYVTKPFSLGEIIARVKARLRRQDVDRRAARRSDLDRRHHHRSARASGWSCAAANVALAPKEFRLLHLLMENRGRDRHPADVARKGLGLRLRGRASDDQRSHPLAAREDRARSRTTRGTSSPSAAAATCSASNFPWRRTSSRRCGGFIAGALGVFVATRRPCEPHRRPANTVPAPVPADSDAAQRVLAALPFAAFLIDGGSRVRYLNAAAESLFETDAQRSTGRCSSRWFPRSHSSDRWAALGGSGLDARRRDRSIATANASLGITRHPYRMRSRRRHRRRPHGNCWQSRANSARLRGERVARAAHAALAAIKLMLETVIAAEDDAEARASFMPQVAARDRPDGPARRRSARELARSESGRLIMRKERFDLTDVAAAVVNTFAQRSSAAGHRARSRSAGRGLRRRRPRPA